MRYKRGIMVWTAALSLLLSATLFGQSTDSCEVQKPGDVNNDGNINVADAAYLATYFCQGGPAPQYLYNADATGDCVVDSMDVIRIFFYAFKCAENEKCGYIPVACTCQEPVIGEYFQDLCVGELPGDANTDGVRNVGDAVYIINYVFRNGSRPGPFIPLNGDANCDCNIDVGDAVYLVQNVFKGGPPPCECGDWVSPCNGCFLIFNWLLWQ